MTDQRINDLREWLDRVSKKTGLKLTPLANHIGVSPSTLTRIPKPDYKGLPSTDTIAKLVDASGIPAPASIMGGETVGFHDTEASPYFPNHQILPKIRVIANNTDTWQVHTDLLNLCGILPGDFIELDMNRQPMAGDLVMAQIYSDNGSAESVARKFDPPFLVALTTNTNPPKPVYVDHEHATILGVITASWREYETSKKRA